MEIKMTLNNGNSAKWSFGSCSSPDELTSRKQYLQKCCMVEKEAVLTCEGSMQWGGGWYDGFLGIETHKFCDVFFNKMMIRLNIQGKYMYSLRYQFILNC